MKKLGGVGFMLCSKPRKIPKQREGGLNFVDPEK